jgi:uncharacterized membrane protein
MKSRRSLIALLVLAVVLVGGLAAYINLSTPQGVAMPWNLTGMGGMNSSVGEHHPFDPAQAQTMTSLEVHVEQWPANDADANAWLSQTIDYGFNTVTSPCVFAHPTCPNRVACRSFLAMTRAGGSRSLCVSPCGLEVSSTAPRGKSSRIHRLPKRGAG